MKLANAYVVAALANSRDKLVFQRNHGTVVVRINDDTLDAAFIAAIGPVVRRVLDERIATIDSELLQLGVEVEPEPA